MSNLRVPRAYALSAGLAAGMLSVLGFAPSAFAQNYGSQPYWNGAPNATGPGSEYNAAPVVAPNGPTCYGPNAGGPVATKPVAALLARRPERHRTRRLAHIV